MMAERTTTTRTSSPLPAWTHGRNAYPLTLQVVMCPGGLLDAIGRIWTQAGLRPCIQLRPRWLLDTYGIAAKVVKCCVHASKGEAGGLACSTSMRSSGRRLR